VVATTVNETIQTLSLVKEITINAPIAIAFEAVLEELGPANETPEGPMPMVLEAWPGGRWFRELSKNSGHLWGHVQVIKAPHLLEICGPLFMSYPCANHLQYRLVAEGTKTHLTLTHRAFGQIPEPHRTGVVKGWEHGLQKIRQIAESR